MAIRPDYTTGTITLTSGQVNFTTAGSTLQAVDIQAGDRILLDAKGLALTIASITGQNAGTLTQPCPAGAAGAAQPLRIRYQPDGSRYSAAVREMIDLLGSGNVAELAALNLVASRLLYTDLAGNLALTALTEFVRGLLDEADEVTFRASIGANNASNLTAGTVPNVRLESRLQQASTLPAGVTDLNNVLTSGFYFAQTGTSNLPNAVQSYVLVIGIANTNFVKQIAFETAGRRIWERFRSTTWSAWQDVNRPQKGYIFGLNLANNALDTVSDIDIAPGACVSTEAEPVLMTLGSTLTKQLNSGWAVGNNAGGLDTGALTENTYHVWLIQRSDTGVVDALFSLSPIAPTMPAGYDRKRRIGSIVREVGGIRQFYQLDDLFVWRTAAQDRNSTAATVGIALTLTVPTGIAVWPIFNIIQVSATGRAWTQIRDGLANSLLRFVSDTGVAGQTNSVLVDGSFQTNNIGQIVVAVTISSGSLASHILNTCGWYDNRGRLS